MIEHVLPYEILDKLKIDYKALKVDDIIKIVPNGTFKIISRNEEYKLFKVVKLSKEA